MLTSTGIKDSAKQNGADLKSLQLVKNEKGFCSLWWDHSEGKESNVIEEQLLTSRTWKSRSLSINP